MKKVFKIISSLCLIILLTVSCSSTKSENKYTLEKFSGKVFDGMLGGQMWIEIDKPMFKRQGKDMVYTEEKGTYIGFTSKKSEIIDGEECSVPNIFLNARIIEENGKFYLMADRLPERFEILDENTVKTNSDKNTFRYVNLLKEVKK